MQFFRLLTVTVALALFIVTINGVPPIQRQVDNDYSPEIDLPHRGEVPDEDHFEDSVNLLPAISVGSDVFGEVASEEHDQKDSVHRQRRAAKRVRSK